MQPVKERRGDELGIDALALEACWGKRFVAQTGLSLGFLPAPHLDLSGLWGEAVPVPPW